jgi:putative FmdB family regulatory protein
MPTYEYICDACGNEFEKFASMSAPPEKKCPKCGKRKVQRKISVGGGIIFKGGGFYETDYRNEAYKKAAEADKPSEAKSDSAETKTTEATAKAETKPAEKSETRPADTKAADPKSLDTATKASEPGPAASKPTATAKSEPKASKSAAKPKR